MNRRNEDSLLSIVEDRDFRTLIYLTPAIFLLLVVVQYIGASFPDNHSFGHITFSLMSTVLGSGGSGAIIAMILHFYRHRGELKRRKKLLKFLGIKSPTSSMAIVLPRFDIAETQANATERFDSPIIDNAVKDSRLTLRTQLALDDVVAIRYLSALCGRVGLNSPDIIFDDYAWAGLFPNVHRTIKPQVEPGSKAIEDYEAIFLIGLFSSHVTMEFAENVEYNLHRSFRLTTLEDFHRGFRGLKICPQNDDPYTWCRTSEPLTRENTPHEIHRDLNEPNALTGDLKDIALIAKCLAPKNQMCIILGGGSARGTRLAAKYLSENWEWLMNQSTPESGGSIKVETRYFSAALSVDAGEDKRLKLRELHIEVPK
jgi:hypothetical protein